VRLPRRRSTSKVIVGGKRHITALHIQGDMPDLHGLGFKFLDSDIWALTDCRLASMAHKDLRDLNREHPRLGEEL
jgi:CRP-like cAMP-binding protein